MSEVSDLRRVADQLEIMGVLHRYAKGLDTFDAAPAASCFAESAVYHIGEEVLRGRVAIESYFDDASGARSRHTGLDAVEQFTHAVSNPLIEMDGDRAVAESLVTVYVVGPRAGQRVLLVRGVRYRDELVRQDNGWQIQERHHELQWMYETTPTLVASAAH